MSHDVTIDRVVIHQPHEYLYGSAENLANRPNKIYTMRQAFELKSGTRYLLNGVTWNGGHSNFTQGASFLLSPRCHSGAGATVFSSTYIGGQITSWTNGVFTITVPSDIGAGAIVAINGTAAIDGLYEVTVGTTETGGAQGKGTQFTIGALSGSSGTGGTGQNVYMVKSHKGVTDITLQNSLMFQNVNMFELVGRDGSCTGVENSWTDRVKINNVLGIDVDGRSIRTDGAGRWEDALALGIGNSANASGGKVLYDQGNSHNIKIDNISVWGFRGTSSGLRAITTEGISGRFQSYNWLICDTGTIGNLIEKGFSTNAEGNSGIAQNWLFGSQQVGDIRDWVVCRSTPETDYPASFKWPANAAALKLTNPTLTSMANLDVFRLRHDSTYKPGGADRRTHGYRYGADITRIQRAIGQVKGAAASATGTTTAKVCWEDPDLVAVNVEYGTSATYGTGTRQASASGSYRRCVDLAGLTTKTAYYVRILSAAEQPMLSFRTQ
jgi:hypothetical protein